MYKLSHVFHIYSFSHMEYTFFVYVCLSLYSNIHNTVCSCSINSLIFVRVSVFKLCVLYTKHRACSQAHQLVCWRRSEKTNSIGSKFHSYWFTTVFIISKIFCLLFYKYLWPPRGNIQYFVKKNIIGLV